MLKPDNQQSSGKSNQRCPEEHQQPNIDNEEDEQSNTDNDEGDEQLKTDNNEVHVQPSTDNDKEDDIVPVVIRPGHIRFENLGKGVCIGIFRCTVQLLMAFEFSNLFYEFIC